MAPAAVAAAVAAAAVACRLSALLRVLPSSVAIPCSTDERETEEEEDEEEEEPEAPAIVVEDEICNEDVWDGI